MRRRMSDTSVSSSPSVAGCETFVTWNRMRLSPASMAALPTLPSLVSNTAAIDPQYDGVPQRRRRVFVVCGFGGGSDPAEVLFEPEGLFGDIEAGGGAGEDLAGTLAGGARGRGGYSTDDIPLVVEAYGGGNTSGPIDVAAYLTAKGQRIDFEVETFIVEMSPALRAQPNVAHDSTKETYIAHTLRGEGFDASKDGTGRGVPLVPIAFSSKDHGADAGDMAPTLRAMGHSGSHANGGGQIAIAFNARQDPECTGDMAGSLDCSSPQAQAVAWSIRRPTP